MRAAVPATAAATSAPAPPLPHRWLALRWGLTRLLAVAVLVWTPEGSILGDVRYYWREMGELFGPGGLGGVLPEYPAPAMAVFVPPWWVAGGREDPYLRVFVLLMLATDAAFTWVLWRSAGRRGTPGVWLWLLLVPTLGPLTYARFDLVSGALAGAALLALAARRPGTAGLLTGAGAAAKLWPAALLPALLVHRSGRGRVVAGVGAVGAVAVVGTLATGGIDRLLSPLTWQGDRGLQIESLFAVPLLWARAVSPSSYDAPYTRYFAFEIEGPGAASFQALSTLAMLAMLALLAWLWWRALRRTPAADAIRVAGLLSLGTACLLVITNKTLSPQYLLWVGGLLAALGCVTPDEPTLPRLGRLLLVTCLATQVIYPLGYGMLTSEAWYGWIGVSLLTARNLALVVLTVLVLRRVVDLTRAPAASPESPVTARPVGR